MSDADRIAEYRRRLAEAARSSREGRAVVRPVMPRLNGLPEDAPRVMGKNGKPKPRPYIPGFGKFPTSAQWRKLREELGGCTQGEARAFVSYANGYAAEPFNSLALMQAIELAMRGVNTYGTAEQLVELSWNEDVELKGSGMKLFKRRAKAPPASRPIP